MKIVPLVLGSLGTISKQFGNRLKEIGITAKIGQVQKTVSLRNGYNIKKDFQNLRLWLDFERIFHYYFIVCQFNINNKLDLSHSLSEQ